MERVTLTWSITNWVTVLIMVGLAYAALMFGVTLAKKYMPSSSPNLGASASGSPQSDADVG